MNSLPPPLGARTHRRVALATMLALVLPVLGMSTPAGAAVTGGDGSRAALAARLHPGSHVGAPPLTGTEPAEQDSPAGVGGGIVVDLEPLDPAAEPLTGTQLHHPAIRLTGDGSAGETAETDAARADRIAAVTAAARRVEGVALATEVLVGSLTFAPEGAEIEVDVAAVDPESFRLLTPRVTAEAVDVWRRVTEGDAAFIHEVGQDWHHEHEIDLGDRVALSGGDLDGEEATSDRRFDEGLAGLLPPGTRTPSAPGRGPETPALGETLRVGAYASNGAPPLADALVSHDTAEALGLSGETIVLVALDGEADPGEVAGQLSDLTGLDAEVVPQPQARRAFLSRGESQQAFEPFTYVSLGDGMIQIERDWVRHNIVSADVPVFRGQVTCHRLMIPQLHGALQEVEDRGLADLIDTSQYGGCWVPRHILFDPGRAISMHAWGLAVDFNVSTNQYGADPQMDERIVEIFERWGFAWGGDWSTPDGMHFELAVLLDGGGE